MRVARLFAVMLFALLSVALANAGALAQEAEEAAIEASGPWQYPRTYNSLTGMPYPDEEALERRNLIVKISNYPPVVRPQAGLNQADLVYEVESEGGTTRFAAIYRSQAPRHVGPVRSARLLDMELMTMYSAFLAYSGSSVPIQRLIWDSPNAQFVFSPLTGDNCFEAGFCRHERPGVSYEHTLYLDTQQLYRAADARYLNTGYKAIGFAFDTQAKAGGQPVREVRLSWPGEANAIWQYDEESERWLRFSDGEAHYDALDGEQIWADNLVVLRVEQRRRPDLFTAGAMDESWELLLWGQGPALVAREGRWHSGSWARSIMRQRSMALELIHTGSSRPILLKPGRSWISIVRQMSDVTLSEQLTDFTSREDEVEEAGNGIAG